MSYIEQMLCNDEERRAYQHDSTEFGLAAESLRKQFGPMDVSGWYSVSSPQYNSIYDDLIVSVVFRVKPPYLDSFEPAAVGRKLFLRRGWIYVKGYTFTDANSCPLPYPPGGQPMFIGKMVNVYGQPGDSDLSQYQCLYFMHQDHAAVELWSAQKLPNGQYSTFYSATLDTQAGNRLLRMKTYCYEDQGGFSDWDVVWIREAKRRGVLEDALGSN